MSDPMLYLAIILAAMGAGFLWLLLFINPREHDEALADHDWHRCAWCKCYFHAKSGVMQMTKPKYAPENDSHGMCPDCFVLAEKDFKAASESPLRAGCDTREQQSPIPHVKDMPSQRAGEVCSTPSQIGGRGGKP